MVLIYSTRIFLENLLKYGHKFKKQKIKWLLDGIVFSFLKNLTITQLLNIYNLGS